MSKFKTGAMVILIGAYSKTCMKFVGQIHVLGRKCDVYNQCWRMDPPLIDKSDGFHLSWHEGDMVVIEDKPGEDETLQWAPVPAQKLKEPA